MTQLLWGSAHQQGNSVAVDVQQVNFFPLVQQVNFFPLFFTLKFSLDLHKIIHKHQAFLTGYIGLLRYISKSRRIF